MVGWQFTYDNLGNRITLNNRAGNDVVYAHNVANEYTSIGGTNVSHDAAGNLSADDNGYTYEYDHDNRLTKIKKNSGATTVAEFTYDALGRRIEAIDSIATTTTRYYYDGWRVLSETNAGGTKLRHYVYGNYLDEALLLIHDDGQATPTYTDYYYAHNHLYSPTALIEDDGDVVERYEYDVYGKPSIMDASYNARSSSNYDNVVMFTGQRLDRLDSGDLQLMNYKYRIYELYTGRFLQRDPLEYYDELNLYSYIGSNPLRETDPYGEGWGINWNWVLDQLTEFVLGGKLKIHPTQTTMFTDEDCCCKKKKYKKMKISVGVRVKIGDILNIDGEGHGHSCGPCEDKICVSISGGANISKAALSIALKKIPKLGKKLVDKISKFGTVRVKVRGSYCFPGGLEKIEACVSIRFAYIGGWSNCPAGF